MIEARSDADDSVPAIDLDVASLRVLAALLRTTSTVQAARELHVTQSAVSHSLKRLRIALRDPLFVRVGRAMVATERALSLRVHVRDALSAIAKVAAAGVAFEPARAKGVIRIAMGDYAELVMLPALLALLHRDAPELDVVCIGAGDRLEEMLQRGEVDLSVGGFFRERAGLVMRTLFHDPFVVAMAREGAPKRMTMRRYLEARHVIASPRGLPGGIVDDALHAEGFSRRIVLRTPTFQTALAVAARGEVLVTVPRSLAEAYAQHAPIRIFTPPLSIPPVRFALVFPASRSDEVLHRWVRERIVKLLAK